VKSKRRIHKMFFSHFFSSMGDGFQAGQAKAGMWLNMR